MVLAYRGNRAVAALEAVIPDAAALVFASLGIALALHGKRAIRARLLNVGAVATYTSAGFQQLPEIRDQCRAPGP